MDLQLVMRRAASALLLGAALAGLAGCGVVVRAVTGEEKAVQVAGPVAAPAAPRELSADERRWAEAAWAYFRTNQDPGQGLTNSVAGYGSSTMWEAGDTLAALVSARALELIDAKEFDYRFSLLLGFLGTMELADGKLPNKTYDVRTGRMTRNGAPGTDGWSAVDTGRLLVWLRIAAARHPDKAEYVARAVSRLDLCAAVSPEGRLLGAAAGGFTTRYPEASRGYERYAAIGYRLWGVDVAPPADPAAPVLSGPAMLAGLELGWRDAWDGAADEARALAERQAARTAGGTATARTEFLRKEAPYFVFGTVEAGGQPWAVLEPNGTPQPGLALVSTRAAMGLWALFPERMEPARAVVAELRDDGKGWFEGRYEKTGTYEWTLSASTNAQVLEALHYRRSGPFLADATPAVPPRSCR
ncbi:MAG TPA: DUF3131 domain-containing protein [Azospirillaceae bacterium]|nr:DUF3131 domain-containing protein [Azospirillaceae bacterium]